MSDPRPAPVPAQAEDPELIDRCARAARDAYVVAVEMPHLSYDDLSPRRRALWHDAVRAVLAEASVVSGVPDRPAGRAKCRECGHYLDRDVEPGVCEACHCPNHAPADRPDPGQEPADPAPGVDHAARDENLGIVVQAVTEHWVNHMARSWPSEETRDRLAYLLDALDEKYRALLGED